jgi:hypothetical protein
MKEFSELPPGFQVAALPELLWRACWMGGTSRPVALLARWSPTHAFGRSGFAWRNLSHLQDAARWRVR